MKSIKELDVKGKRVFVRVDYNVPTDADLNITDDNRIKATLDLIEYLMRKDAKIILASHMGRPKGEPDPRYSLKNTSIRLSQLIDKPVSFAPDCIGHEVADMVDKLENGQILMLENLRFHAQEKSNDDEFSREMAALCDIYVNNAFAVSHRDQASVTGIPKFVGQKAAGFLLEKELQSYYDSVKDPKRPLLAVIGGAKVSSKLAALENMLKFVDQMVIGGAMANTFLKATGTDTKGSMIEAELLETAIMIIEAAKENGVELLLPVDLICAEKFDAGSNHKAVSLDQIPNDWMALDIGPITAEKYAHAVSTASTIVWNGPMGVFEMESFMSGTQVVADAIAVSEAFSIVGGGDTGLAAKQCGVADQVSYISTGGGAFLHLMEGKQLPGVVALE